MKPILGVALGLCVCLCTCVLFIPCVDARCVAVFAVCSPSSASPNVPRALDAVSV